MTLRTIPGEAGDNATGIYLDGLVETQQDYVVAYSANDSGNETDARNVFLAFVDRDTLNVRTVQLTDYEAGSSYGASLPYLVKQGNQIFILWNETKNGKSTDQLCWAVYKDGQVGETQRSYQPDAMLSACQPVAWNDGVVWYTTQNSAPVFYCVTEKEVMVLWEQEETPTGKPVIVDEAQITLVGSDVYEGSVVYRYYQDAGCRMELSGVPEEPGIYYVKAFVEAHGNYAAAESDPARLEVMAGEEEEKPGESGGEPEQPDSGGQTPSDGGIVSETGGQMASRPEETPGEAMSDLPFADVPADAWYYEAIAYICGKGMMNGVAETRFAPQAELTRGMIVTILYRLETDPTYSAALFPDVPVDAYYTNATAWANSEGLITGVTDTTLNPKGTATRAQVATILMRFCENAAK